MPVKWNSREIRARIATGAMRGVMRGTERVHDRATQRIMGGPKTGKKWPGLPNQSSAPGESPATQFGDLQRSGRTSYDVPTLTGRATWDAAHALPLELGTPTIEERPFARPSLAESVEGIIQDVRDEIARELGR